MEPLSTAANAFAVVSIAFQLTEACVKLYQFWESVEDAPADILAIKEDLHYLISVFRVIEADTTDASHSTSKGVYQCRFKIAELLSIVQGFDVGFQSASRKKRVWTAFKAARYGKQVQKFRDSLSETKASLMLAMIHESFIQTRRMDTLTCVNVCETLHQDCITSAVQIASPGSETRQRIQPRAGNLGTQAHATAHFQSAADHLLTTNTLMNFKRAASEQSVAKFQMQELMFRVIAQTAVAAFQPSSLEIFAQDGYFIDGSGRVQTKTFVYGQRLRYRIRHHTTSFRTALGCLWARTTSLRSTDDSGSTEASRTITSLIFYPTAWLKYLGFRSGLEAILSSAGRSWVFDCRLTVTCAVPEDSVVFELCRTGQTRAVEILLAKGLASVVDTSPDGWRPLHFAAAAGHVDLCAMLIRAGADKSALVYRGPSESILSPISLFVTYSSSLHAEAKIAMLRLFHDCIDLSTPESDGWTVHEWLKRAYAREKVPISQNSITWLLYMTAKEEFVECNPRIIWLALQHAVRSVLNHARHGRYLERVLGLPEAKPRNERYLHQLGFCIALRVVGRALLPMLIYVGSFLQMRGFDWIDDHLPHREFLRAQPNLYAAWCHAVLDAVENLEDYTRKELDSYLRQLGKTQGHLLDTLFSYATFPKVDNQEQSRNVCIDCKYDYGFATSDLVEPARIAVTECVKTGHNSDCVCNNFQNPHKMDQLGPTIPEYTGSWELDSVEVVSAVGEQFVDAQPHIFTSNQSHEESALSDIATLLYRAQGRNWIGGYVIDARLCSICFLLKEQYIGEDGLAAEFPPMPRSFEGLRMRR